MFFSIALYFWTRFAYLIFFAEDIVSLTGNLVNLSFWFFPFYAAAFLIFGVKDGLKIASGYHLATFAIGAIYLIRYDSTPELLETLHTLSQLYLAGGVTILLVYTFARLIEGHVKTAYSLEYLANTDALTKVNNRRGLEALLDQEAARLERYGGRLSIVLIDLDNFKSVNDGYGHDVGDEVLRQLAILLKDETRNVDHIGRWGGEEFLLILPGVGLLEAKQLALRLKKRIESRAWSKAGKLTASFGVAEFEPKEGDTMERLLKRADDALYGAKAAGKNRVAVRYVSESS